MMGIITMSVKWVGGVMTFNSTTTWGWFAKVLHWIGAAIILVVLARCSKAGSGIFRELTPSPNNIGRDRAGRLQHIKTRHGNES
jgi:hypothetical protein